MDLKRIERYYDSLRKASELLELDERASLNEVKKAYRAKARLWHPDKTGDGNRAEAEERMKALNEAYALLKAYCDRYPIPFNMDSLRETDPFYDHLHRFYHDYFSESHTADDEEPPPK